MSWNLDGQEETRAIGNAAAESPVADAPSEKRAPRTATIFEETEGRPLPDLERIIRLEKKINGALYLLKRAESARRNRRAGMFFLFFVGLAAVGYAYWPQLRDADWGAVRDIAQRGGDAFQERRFGAFLADEFGDTSLGKIVAGARATLENAADRPQRAAMSSTVSAPAIAAPAAAASSGVSAPKPFPPHRPRPATP